MIFPTGICTAWKALTHCMTLPPIIVETHQGNEVRVYHHTGVVIDSRTNTLVWNRSIIASSFHRWEFTFQLIRQVFLYQHDKSFCKRSHMYTIVYISYTYRIFTPISTLMLHFHRGTSLVVAFFQQIHLVLTTMTAQRQKIFFCGIQLTSC